MQYRIVFDTTGENRTATFSIVGSDVSDELSGVLQASSVVHFVRNNQINVTFLLIYFGEESITSALTSNRDFGKLLIRLGQKKRKVILEDDIIAAR